MSKYTNRCPLLQEECIEHVCRWYTHIQGQQPQTGEPIDRWGCAVEFLPMLLIEGARATRTVAAGMSEANEVQKQALKSAALKGPTPELRRLLGIADA